MKPIVDISVILLELGLAASVTETERAIVSASLDRACAAVRNFLGYDPVYAERTEYYPQGYNNQPGGGVGIWEVDDTTAYVRRADVGAQSELQIRHLPVRSITSLKIDYDGRSGTKAGSFGSSTAKTEGEDFWPNYDMVDSAGDAVCLDGLIRSHGLWPTEPGSVKIVYYAGYKDAELMGADSLLDASAIQEVVVNETRNRFLRTMNSQKKRLAGWTGPLSSENLGDYSYSIDAASRVGMNGRAQLEAASMTMLTDGGFVNMGWRLGV